MKSSTKSNTKKMVQARLPFKRLNPVPKDEGCLEEKKIRIPQNVSPQKMLYSLNSSMEDMENDCEMETEMTPIPKAINGKGPLDNYIRKAPKASNAPSIITIDLTEDSNISTSNDSPLNGESRAQLANGTVSPERSTTNAPLSTNEECTVSVDNKSLENMSFPELELDKPHQSAASCTSVSNFSPERAVKEDYNSSADDDSVSVSSSSSPVSLSSPDVQTGSKFTNGSSPSTSTTPTGKATSNKTSAEKKKTKDKAEKRQAEKEERECARREARAAKDLAKKKREGEREQREKDKKEKKEREDREKAEKNRLKEEKKKEKLEALEAKQEEKRKKEEEKRQKEEEKRLKEEEKRIKAEKAEITRFLQKPKTPQAPKTFARSCGKFAPFEIKKGMALAPLCRIDFEQEASEELDIFLQEQTSESSFLDEIKKRRPRKMGQTTVPTINSVEVDDVQVLGETDPVLGSNMVLEEHIKDIGVPERKKFGRMKLLQFCENHRPAYWGTSNKRSRVINPRKPWAQDTDMLDYEVDSDEEWEEEEPGESLSHSEGENEDDDPKEEEDEDDDGFFVPHGYLSNDEGVSDEECTDPENQKVRQKLKAKEWDDLQSNSKKIRVLQPVVIGCVWCDSKASEIRLLQKFSACILESPAVEEELTQDISSAQKIKDRQILSKLVPLLHGNVNGSKIIIQEFQECCRRGLFLEDNASHATDIESTSPNSTPQTPSNIIVPSKARLKRLISENSVYEKRPEHRMCWYVHSDVLKGLQQDNLPVPCQWTYITQVNSVSKENNGANGGSLQSLPLSGKRKSAGSMPITKFMKRARDLETAVNTDMDGFQADTEEEEDDDDCMIIEDQQAKDAEDSTIECKINLNDSAILASCQN
ncbi:chromatin assembly factor 1 subunit A-B [Xenopus laevis]|nr:chromatin assembly factor 1 subunit A-B [Xenopus laevis]AAI25994.1 LOC733264 protein [Xenopus laevis]